MRLFPIESTPRLCGWAFRFRRHSEAAVRGGFARVAQGAEHRVADQVAFEDVVGCADRVLGVLDHPELGRERVQRLFIRRSGELHRFPSTDPPPAAGSPDGLTITAILGRQAITQPDLPMPD